MTTKNKQMTDCIQNTLYAYEGEKELGFKFLNLLAVVHCSNKGIWGSNTVESCSAAGHCWLDLVPGRSQTKNRLSSFFWPTGEQLYLVCWVCCPWGSESGTKAKPGGASMGSLYICINTACQKYHNTRSSF